MAKESDTYLLTRTIASRRDERADGPVNGDLREVGATEAAPEALVSKCGRLLFANATHRLSCVSWYEKARMCSIGSFEKLMPGTLRAVAIVNVALVASERGTYRLETQKATCSVSAK